MGKKITIRFGPILVCPGLDLLLCEHNYGSCGKEGGHTAMGVVATICVSNKVIMIANMDCMLLWARHCSKFY